MTQPDELDVFLRELREAGCSGEEIAELASVLDPTQPPDALRERLIASAKAGGRLHRFSTQVAKLLDVSEEDAQRLLDGIDQADNWVANPLPGVTIYHLQGGPAVADAITGFIKLERGGGFPPHGHLGEEHTLVVQGRCRDTATGEELGPGSLVKNDHDDEHAIEVLPGPAFIYLTVTFGGIDIGGMVFKPGDPRI